MQEIIVDKDHIYKTVERSCSISSQPVRREAVWVRECYERFRAGEKLPDKASADRELYRRCFGSEPESDSAVLRIRYWRSGYHYPRNREICELFGRALGLTKEDQRYLMTAWFDRADRIFSGKEKKEPVFMERRALLDRLKQEFIQKIRPEELSVLCAPGTAPESNLRYIYCHCARRYLGNDSRGKVSSDTAHIDTLSYDSQLTKELALKGEVSRINMLRHLLILGMPFVSRSLVGDWLEQLGYLPLDEAHTTTGGDAVDALILGLLEEFEKKCSGKDPVYCTLWFQKAAGIMDDLLEKAGRTSANPFRFKFITGRN